MTTDSNEHLRALIAAVPAGIVTVADDGVIHDVNPAAEQLLGRRAAELAGQSAHAILPGLALLGATAGDGVSRIVLARRPDGTSIPLAMTMSEMRSGGQRYTVLLLDDRSAQMRAETRLRYRLELESAVADVSHRFLHADAATLDATIDMALARMSALSGVDRCYVFQFSEDGETFRNTHEWCADGVCPQMDDIGVQRTNDFTRMIDTLARGDMVHVPCVADMPDSEQPLKSILLDGDIQSFIMVPLSWDNRLRGFLGFDAVRERKEFPEEDIRLLRTVAEIMSRSLASREAARRIDDDAWFLAHLDRVARLFTSSRDLDELLAELPRLLLELFAVDRVWLAHPCDPEAPTLHVAIEATRPEYPGVSAETSELVLDEGARQYLRELVTTPEPLVIQSPAVEYPSDSLARYQIRSQMAMAMHPRGAPAWVVGMHQCARSRDWSARERRLFQAIAERTSDALSLHLTNEQLRLSESRLAFVLESNPAVVYMAQLTEPVRTTYASRSVERLIGYTQEEVLAGTNWLPTIMHPDDIDRAFAQFGEQLAHDGRASVIYRLRKKGGEYVWVQDQQSLIPGSATREVIGCIVDITQQALAEQELERARAAAERALATAEGRLRMLEMAEEVAHFGHWRMDLTTGAIEASKELLRIHGLAPDAATVPDLQQLIDSYYPRDKQAVQASLIIAMIEKRLVVTEAELVRPDGTSRWLQAHTSPELDAGDNVVALFGVVHDITRHKQDEAALVRAREDALAASRVKSQFLANMSHEIRTPLNGVLGLTALLLDSALSTEQRELLEMVRSSGRTLHELIEGVLDISKIEAGKLELETVPFPLCDVVQEAARTVAVRAHEKGLELVVDLAPDLPARVIGDPVRFRQVLTNLLANAVKFTMRGEIELAVRPDADGNIAVSVRDTGIGVPTERHQAIFEAFTQADGSTTREFGGTGLGLAICRELVERMGGRIWVEAAPGGGSVFHFFVALPADHAEDLARPERSPSPLAGARVLVVDENQASGRVLGRLLASWRMEPVLCAGAHEALAALERAAELERGFQFALIDAARSAPGGIELATRLARDPRYRAMARILLVSASFRPEPSLLGDAIVSRCLIKPVSPSTLLDALLMGSAPTAAPARLPTEVLAPGLHVLLAEDNPMNALLIKRILQRSQCAVTHVTTGTAALAAWDNQRFDVVLMDVQMPEIDGLEATRRIRAREQHYGGRTPIIALTANAMKEDEQRCRDAGMDDYLAKPIDIERFLHVLARVHPAQAVLAAAAPAPEPSPDAMPAQPAAGHGAFDAAALLAQLGHDRELAAAVIATFLDTERALLAGIEDALAAGDLAAVARTAHHARGSLLTLHAQPAAAAAQALEHAARSDERHRLASAAGELRTAWRRLLAALGGGLGPA